MDYLRSQDWLPVNIRRRIRHYEKTVNLLEGQLGRSATDDEIASAMHISVAELNSLISQSRFAAVIPLEEYLQNESSAHSSDSFFFELKESLAQALSLLPQNERLVLSLYYFDSLTLKEISLVMHLSEARISQLHSKAILRLRGYLPHIF